MITMKRLVRSLKACLRPDLVSGANDGILRCRINAAFRSQPERRIYAAAGRARRNLSFALFPVGPLVCLALFVCRTYAAPRIEVDQPVWDFGPVTNMTEVTHDFVIRNSGDDSDPFQARLARLKRAGRPQPIAGEQ